MVFLVPRQSVEDAHQAKLEREKEVLKNLEQMERQVKQWKDRMGAKTRMLDAEKERREKILEELRLEDGGAGGAGAGLPSLNRGGGGL